MAKRKHFPTFWLLFFSLLIVGGTFAAVIGWQKCEYEMKLAAHPLGYSEYVEKYADEYGLDKYLLYAVIKTESSFDSNAVSNVGARGLMQIMEETFDWIRFRLGEEELTVYDDMFDPKTNIRYGGYLVSYLMDKFGNIECAAAAYHSGVGTVSEWLSDADISKDGKTLDVIPGKNAAHYVNKINTALETYYALYETERKD